MISLVESLQQFLDDSLTPFHAVDWMRQRLESHGFFCGRSEKSYFVRQGSLLAIAYMPPIDWSQASLHIIGAHTDSPGLKLKSLGQIRREGYLLAETEVYGSPLLYTWLDRDLRLAGKIYLEDGQELLYSSDKAMAKVISLAIHLQRDVNEKGLIINRQNDLVPIFGSEGHDLLGLLAQELKREPSQIHGYELYLVDTQKSERWGREREYLSSARLDNLAMCHAALEAFLLSNSPPHRVRAVVFYDHEEIGSETESGALSDFFLRSLEELMLSAGASRLDFLRLLDNGFFISADMAHGVHPNFPEKHDYTHRPRLNEGPVLKINHMRRYATSGKAQAFVVNLAQRNKIPLQVYHHRSDMLCGTTIGPLQASRLGILTAEIGNPMLAMHSIRETAGTKDHELVVQLFKAFFEFSKK
ncbi:MAG: M18 family aminopeptidase [Leptospiraceae bacterium]|nr:M18 family aminopeptidase [Leptospiraceae bacterium]MDW8307233.1 M18 family aminopeptidase [Leptospiraceae bacterium]